MRCSVLLALAACAAGGAVSSVRRSGIRRRCPPNVRPAQLEGVGIDEHLGRAIDLNLTFTAEDGYPVSAAAISSTRAVR